MNTSEISAVFSCIIEILLHPSDHLISLVEYLWVESWVVKYIFENLFAACADQERFIGWQDRVSLLAGSCSLNKTWVNIFLADFQEFELFPAVVNQLKESVNEEVNILNVEFWVMGFIQYMVEKNPHSFIFQPILGKLLEVGLRVGMLTQMCWYFC